MPQKKERIRYVECLLFLIALLLPYRITAFHSCRTISCLVISSLRFLMPQNEERIRCVKCLLFLIVPLLSSRTISMLVA